MNLRALAIVAIGMLCACTTVSRFEPPLDDELTPAAEAFLESHRVVFVGEAPSSDAVANWARNGHSGAATIYLQSTGPGSDGFNNPVDAAMAPTWPTVPVRLSGEMELAVRYDSPESTPWSTARYRREKLDGMYSYIWWMWSDWEWGTGEDFEERVYITTINRLAAEPFRNE